MAANGVAEVVLRCSWYYAKAAALPPRCNCVLTDSNITSSRPHALMPALSDWLGVHVLKPDADGCRFALPQKFLIFGKTGWIGGLLGEILTAQGANSQSAPWRSSRSAEWRTDQQSSQSWSG